MKRLNAVFAVAAMAALPSQALSATTTGNLSVTATVESSCTVNSPTLAFGSYNFSSNNDATTNISVTCTSGTPYRISLGAGIHGVDADNRKMETGGGDQLTYQLYEDSNRTDVWADESADPASTATGSAVNHTVYGRIPSGQGSVPAGSYSDTVVITLSY